MSVWARRGKSVVPYVWTANDHGIEHGSPPAGATAPRVTTYRIKPGALPGAAQYVAGQSVSIKLDLVPQVGEPWTIARFYPSDDFDWEELTGDDLTSTADCKTIGELCKKLFARNPRKYAEHYYDFERMTPRARHDFAQMLFEFWDNTAFRYEVTKQGFDWSTLGIQKLGAPDIAAIKGDQRLEWVMVKKPAPIVRAVAPGGGAQGITVPPAVFQPLELHITEIALTVQRATSLLEQSAVYLKERAKLAHHATALRVLLQASASSRQGDPTETAQLAAKAREVELSIEKPARTAKLAELLSAEKGAPSAALLAAIRHDLGYVDDIAAELTACRDKICSKLFDDGTSFARLIEEWLVWVIDHKQQITQPVQVMYTRLATAFSSALAVLNETDVEDRYHDKASAVSESVPESEFSDPRNVGASAAHKLTSVLGKSRANDVWTWLKTAGEVGLRGIAHAVIPNIPNIFGNLAGPPSISIALIQLKKWREFHRLIASATTDADFAAKAAKFVDDTILHLDMHGSKMPKPLKERFRAAIEGHDQVALGKLKRDLLDEFSGTFQASTHQKVGALLFQCLALTVAWVDFYDKRQKGEVTATDWVANFVGTAPVAVGGADVLVTVINDLVPNVRWLQRIARTLPGAGMFVGLVASFVGVVLQGMAL